MPPPFVPPLANALPYIENSLKRVRVLFGGVFLVDTKQARLVWERPSYPHYFFLTPELPSQHLRPPPPPDNGGGDSEPAISDIVVNHRTAERAVTSYTAGPLKGLSKVAFGAMDAWFEEDERIFIHPKDPYKRVDVLASSRHVRVEVNGVEVANTKRPRLLFETGLRVRTYIPLADCRQDMLVASKTSTECPYKGVASYYNVDLSKENQHEHGQAVQDIVWWYRSPQLECAEIKGCVAFYDEKVDVWVDGEKQER